MNRITIEKKSSRNAPRAPSVEGGSEVRGSRSAHGLDGPSAVTVRGVFDAEMSSGAVIEVDELNVVYGDFHAVKDLSFHVERGELYALLGTNGAGTTSALAVIEGHRRASSGTVRVFGASPTDRAAEIGRASCRERGCTYV